MTLPPDQFPPSKPEEKDFTSEFIFGVLGGVLTGSILGLWFAPESGRQIRQKIKRATLGQVQEKASEVVDKVRGERIEESIEQGRALAHRHRATEAKVVLLGKDQDEH